MYQDRKFRLDDYFFCGFPSGMPNEKLILEQEAVVSTKPEITGANNMIENQNSVRKILDYKGLRF